LNRDKPGIPSYQVRIGAQDEDGAGQSGIHDFVINLTDINDNAPYLDMVSRLILLFYFILKRFDRWSYNC
jgi:hypothetical protein